MKALLLVAHGSRRKQSNDEVAILAETLKKYCSEQYSITRSAYLELAEPLIPDGIKQCIDDGASSIIVLPYFLNSGRHVIEDIPNIVNQAKQSHPDLEIHIAQHLGASELMMELLIKAANSADEVASNTL
jgi:sirohydrochlorin ferrochelatase